MFTTRLSTIAILLSLCVAASACQSGSSPDASKTPTDQADEGTTSESQPATTSATAVKTEGQPLAEPAPKGMEVATFAGGCFWCMEGPFEKVDGVQAAISGYTGGPEEHPTYKQVSSGSTGHTEAVRVIYDPNVVTYDVLLDVFWKSMDPTDAGGQFADRGSQYRPAIFVHTEEQRELAKKSKATLDSSGRFDKPIIVPIEDASDFWVAEDYHQDYYKTNAERYMRYRIGSGRQGFLDKVWGDK